MKRQSLCGALFPLGDALPRPPAVRGAQGKTQIPVVGTTLRWIMSHPSFEAGVRDVRTGRPFSRSFDTWDTNSQWCYERGRAWATRVPRSIALKEGGRLSTAAMDWYRRFGHDFL